jgi:hypothetical protein
LIELDHEGVGVGADRGVREAAAEVDGAAVVTTHVDVAGVVDRDRNTEVAVGLGPTEAFAPAVSSGVVVACNEHV